MGMKDTRERTMDVIAVLVRIQQNTRLNDTAFAATLGIPRQSWQYYKAGGPLSLKFLQRAFAVYPQIRPQVERLIFGSYANKRSRTPTKAQRAAS